MSREQIKIFFDVFFFLCDKKNMFFASLLDCNTMKCFLQLFDSRFEVFGKWPETSATRNEEKYMKRRK